VTDKLGWGAKTKEGDMNLGKIRPQILVAIISATFFSVFALWIGMEMAATEVVTAVIGGIFGFLGGVSLKVHENE